MLYDVIAKPPFELGGTQDIVKAVELSKLRTVGADGIVEGTDPDATVK